MPAALTNNGINRFGGWIRDRPDLRDEPLYPPVKGQRPLQGTAIGSRGVLPANYTGLTTRDWDALVGIYDQRPYQSCVSCAVASVIKYRQATDQLPNPIDPSRLFLYYNARALEGNAQNLAVGTGIRSAIKGLGRFGVCDESEWDYTVDPPAHPPIPSAYGNARYRRLVSYRRIFRLDLRGNFDQLDLTPIRRSLAEKRPVICGFTAFRSFGAAIGSGVGAIPFPSQADRSFSLPDPDPTAPANDIADRVATFGHAAVIIGYEGEGDESGETGTFTLANSWGRNFGVDGYFTLPAEYLANAELASDFWTIKSLDHPDEDPSGDQQSV